MTMPKTGTAKLSQLHLSDRNMRIVKHDPNLIENMAHSIISVGLLQALVVTPLTGRKKGFEVVAGEGRWRALHRAVELRPELGDLDVSVAIIDSASASEATLAENYMRQQTTKAEIYRAFARIRADRPEATIEEMGALFGYDAPRAGRIMRLANLDPKIMDAYVGGTLAVDVARADQIASAYASTEDRALQVQVFESFVDGDRKGSHHDAQAVKRALSVGCADLTPKLRLVGLDAYRTAGGIFEADLLAMDDHEGRILSPAILNDLASAKVDELRHAYALGLSRDGRSLANGDALEDLGFAWVDAAPTIKEHGYEHTDHELLFRPRHGAMPEAQQARYDDIVARLTEIEESDADGTDEGYAEHEKLTAEMEALEKTGPLELPAIGAIVGVSKIGRDGQIEVSLYYADRDEAGLTTRKGAKSVAAAGAPKSPAEQERSAYGLSKDGMQGMMLLHRDAVRGALRDSALSGSSLALDFLLYSQAMVILTPTKGYSGHMFYNGEKLGIGKIADDNDNVPSKQRGWAEQRIERASWQHMADEMRAMEWATANDPVEGFALFRAGGDQARHYAAALIAGHSLLASTSYYSEGRTPRMVQELAYNLEMERGFSGWREQMDMDEQFFEAMSHKARMRLLGEWGLADRAKGLKASETAKFCARVVNATEADANLLGMQPEDRAAVNNWVPEFFATGPVAPLVPAAKLVLSDNDDEDQDMEDDLAAE